MCRFTTNKPRQRADDAVGLGGLQDAFVFTQNLRVDNGGTLEVILICFLVLEPGILR
jgi:hypothetical protein